MEMSLLTLACRVPSSQTKFMADFTTESEIVVVSEGGGDELEAKSVPGSDDEDSMSVVSVDSLVCDLDVKSLEACEIGTLGSGSGAKSVVASGVGVEIEELGPSLATVQNVPIVLEDSVEGIRPSVLLKDYVPLWGLISICGRRPEMEDAVSVVPWFHEIPLRLLIGDRMVDGMNPKLSCLPAHFFGVYDGHGGAQVANYCQNRIHSALIEEIGILNNSPEGTKMDDCKNLWERALTSCFLKVDDEVGGKAKCGSDGPSEPIAPETVGSTAVVALVSSSHIIVANCGDSRAVLYRGKQCVPLSVDHKVSPGIYIK